MTRVRRFKLPFDANSPWFSMKLNWIRSRAPLWGIIFPTDRPHWPYAQELFQDDSIRSGGKSCAPLWGLKYVKVLWEPQHMDRSEWSTWPSHKIPSPRVSLPEFCTSSSQKQANIWRTGASGGCRNNIERPGPNYNNTSLKRSQICERVNRPPSKVNISEELTTLITCKKKFPILSKW